MTRYALIGTAALLSLLGATPVLAQHMIEEPGNFAFYHPNGDLGLGYSQPQAYASTVMRSNVRMGSRVVVTKRRHRK